MSTVLGDMSNSTENMEVALSPGATKRLRAPTFGSSFNLHTLEEHLGGEAGASRAAYEIAVSGLNRPRMLSRVSTALFDIGLNISEAHVFSARTTATLWTCSWSPGGGQTTRLP